MSPCQICQDPYASYRHSRLRAVPTPEGCDTLARELEPDAIRLCASCHVELHKRMEQQAISTDEAVKSIINSFKVGMLGTKPLQ